MSAGSTIWFSARTYGRSKGMQARLMVIDNIAYSTHAPAFRLGWRVHPHASVNAGASPRESYLV